MDSQLFRVALVTDSPRGVFLFPRSVDAGHIPEAIAAAALWRSLDGGTVHIAAFPADDDAGAVFGMKLINVLKDDRSRLRTEIERLRWEAERLRGRGAMLRIAALAVAGFLGGLVGGWATTHAARHEPLAKGADTVRPYEERKEEEANVIYPPPGNAAARFAGTTPGAAPVVVAGFISGGENAAAQDNERGAAPNPEGENTQPISTMSPDGGLDAIKNLPRPVSPALTRDQSALPFPGVENAGGQDKEVTR